eukprot:TRINITY_DN4835_c0_g1_i1.p1 TRINITY_DN4835_c0_g1~~TRINITY_DN4835_c0_g1_i1.p1  ORF type:complete len:288 (-),score=84.57 TRINITY_DN4835_c0_g1_i1:13-876(-)
MDITDLFTKSLNSPSRTHIIREKKNKESNALIQTATEILGDIDSLHKFLVENKREYLNTTKFTRSGGMTERERDEIDAQTKAITKQCISKIDQLKNAFVTLSKNFKRDHIQHLNEVIKHLYIKLQDVTELYAQLKQVRYKKAQDTLKETGIRKRRPIVLNEALAAEIQPSQSKKPTLDLSDEEKKVLELENKHLQVELETLVDQTKQIERQLQEIIELQDFFATKVVEQSQVIELNLRMGEESHANVDSAVGELLQASGRGADFRVFVLMFLIIASLSLLFLDWAYT